MSRATLLSSQYNRTHFPRFRTVRRHLRHRRLIVEALEDRRLLASADPPLDLFSTSPGEPRYVLPDPAWKTAPAVLFTGNLSDAQPLIVVGDPDGTPPVTPTDRIDPNVPDSPFAGVVSVRVSRLLNDLIGSGSLISPIHVLTAAHVVDLDHDGTIDVSPDDVTVYFNHDNPASSEAGSTAIGVSEIHVHPDWTGFKNPVENDDVAILTLSLPAPWGVPVYPLNSVAFMNAELIVLAGYGMTGEGVNGFILNSANYVVKRTGQNLASLHLLDDEGSGQREVFLFDFDGPYGHWTGDVFNDGPTLGNGIEAMPGPGDSGGPSFLWSDANASGQIEADELTQFGINTFISSRADEPPLFGSFAGGMIVSTYLDWIESIVGGVAELSPSLVWEYDTTGAYSVALSADGSRVVVGTASGPHVLDGQGNPQWTYDSGNQVIDVAMNGDANEIAAVGRSNSSWGGGGPVYLFDRDGNLLETVSDSYYSSVAYSPQGDYYAVTYESWTGWYDQAALWDSSSGWLWYDRTIGESGSGSVSVSANGITATGAAMMGTTSSAVRVYGRTGSLTWTYPMSGTIGADYSVAITADGNYVVAGNTKNANLQVLDVANKQLLWEYNTGNIQGVAVSSDGGQILAGASDAVYLFDASGSLQWATGITGIQDVAFSADASLIVVATASGKVYAFDVSNDPGAPPPPTLESFEVVDAEVNSTGVPSQRKLAVTSDGHLHTVYHRLDPAGVTQIFHAESADGGETWVEEPITSGGENKSFPAVAVDSLDVLHLVWQDANQATYYTRKATTWQTPEWVASYATTPAIAVDGNDHVHVVYGVYVLGSGYWGGGDGIRWRVRTPAGWQAEQRISSDRYWSRYPAIAIDGDNRVHVVWNHAPRSTYYDVHYRVRTSSGWGTEVEVNAETNNEWGAVPSIAVDSENHAHVVWGHLSEGSWAVKYREYSGVLEPTVNIVGPTSYPQLGPVVSLDGGGRIHVVWHGKHENSPTTYQLRHKRYDSSWRAIANLTASEVHDQTGVSVLFANHPTDDGQRNNVLEDGCALIWMDDTTIRYGTVRDVAFPPFGIDQWWATVGVGQQLTVTWTTEVSVRDQYFLDLDIERWNSWDLTEKAKVTFNGQTAGFNGSGTANLGELSPGVYQFIISSFAVPDSPVVEEITFQLIRDVFGPLNPSRDLTTLFVADHAETDLPSSFRIQDADVCKDLPSVQALVDHFAPILHFDLGERYAMPFDVQISLDADAHSSVDGLRVNGNADDNLDLSDLASGEWSPESSTPTVYASVLVCPAGHASCQAGQELAINYWLHYPRSNWSDHHGYNTHEGDWEGATVFLKLEGGVWTPNRVAFGQHIEFLANFGGFASTDGGDVVAWDHLDREGSQSHWYVGLGGHATYSVSGTTTWWNVSEDFPWFDRYEESHTGNGKIFHSQGHVEYLPRVGDSSVPSWLLYPGFWGDDDLDDDGSLLDGDQAPRGPVFQDLAVLSVIDKAGQRWLDPWAWSDGFSTPPKAIHADEFDINVDNDIVLARAGEYLVVSVDGVVVWNTTVAGSTDSLIIYGQTGNDTLTIDFSNGDPLPSGGLTFVGGDGAGNQFDTLVVANGVFQNVVNTLLSPHAGTIQLDGQLPITYVGLAPVDFIGDQIANLTIHLPDGADGALIEDAGDVDDGLWRIRSADSPPTFEQTTFPSPSGSLTIKANGGDTVTVASFDSLFSTPNLTFGGTCGGNRFELSASERLPNAAAVTLTGDAELHLNSYTETIGSLSDPTGGTRVSLAGGTLVTGGNHASTTFAGDITGNGVLTKTGNGVFRLVGANGVSRATVEAGTLLVNAMLTAAHDVQVHNGGTLGGTGTIAAPAGVLVLPGGTLDPGECDPSTGVPLAGRLTIEGDVYVQPASGGLPAATFRVQLGGLTPGLDGYDQLVLNGGANLFGAVADGAGGGVLDLQLLSGYSVPVGGEYVIISNDSTDLIRTRFRGLSEGAFLSPNPNLLMNISYLAGVDDNDVVLTAPGRYDFNGFDNRTEENYIGVSPFQTYPENGAGWVTESPYYLPWYFERGDASQAGWDRLRYDGQATNPMGDPLQFQVDVVDNKTYEVMILTGDASWNHDRESFTVTGSEADGSSDSEVVGVWGAGAPDGSGTLVTWGGGAANPTTGYYRWVRLTVSVGEDTVDGIGTITLEMEDMGGSNGTTVILAMDIRPVDTVGQLTLVRAAEPADTPPFDALPADAMTVDRYTGTGAPPNAVLTVTVSAGGQYAKVTPDGELATFGGQVTTTADGSFEFFVQRPATLTVNADSEDWTIVVEESSGLSRGTAIQPYKAPDDSAPLRFDFGATTSPVQTDFLQVVPQTIYNATRGYGWLTRVAAGDRRDNYDTYQESAAHDTASFLRTDFNSGRNATFKVDVPNGTYSVRLYHSNPLYFGRVPYTTQPFTVTAENVTYTVSVIPPGTTYIKDVSGVTVTDGTLDILLGVNSTAFMIAGIDISRGTLPTESPLLASGDPQDGGVAAISQDMLQSVAAEAAARWMATGLTPAQTATLAGVQYAVADLGGAYLGLANPGTNTIRIDDDAAMMGWSEVSGQKSVDDGPMTKDKGPITTDGLSLLTVVMHELGHLLGYGHSEEADDLMAPVLSAGRASGVGSRIEAIEPLEQADWLSGLHSFALTPARLDKAFEDLGRSDLADGDGSGDSGPQLLDSPAIPMVPNRQADSRTNSSGDWSVPTAADRTATSRRRSTFHCRKRFSGTSTQPASGPQIRKDTAPLLSLIRVISSIGLS